MPYPMPQYGHCLTLYIFEQWLVRMMMMTVLIGLISMLNFVFHAILSKVLYLSTRFSSYSFRM